MQSYLHTRPAAADRRGIATLEFAMALPVLLLLMVAITWLGFSVIGQAEVLVQARNNAWKRRFEDVAQKPLMFPSGLGDIKNPFYPGDKDYVTETASKKVSVSNIFNRIPGPEASAMVLAGSWDHAAMPFNKTLDWDLMGIAALSATGGKAQTWLTQLNNIEEQMKDLGSQILAGIGQQQSDIENSDSSSSAGSAAAKEAEDTSKANQEADKEKYAERLRTLGGYVNPLNEQVVPTSGGELQQTIDDLDKLKTELATKKQAPPLDDKDAEKKRQAELDSLTRQVDVLTDRQERIESDIRDAWAELKALS
jgi:hypothetical protein